MKSYNTISTYDKGNNLVGYVEYSDYIKGQPKCLYIVNGNILNRIHVNEDYTSSPPIFESVNSYIEFNDNIMLQPLTIDGESRMEIIKSGNTYSFTLPSISDRFDTYHELSTISTEIENFRLKPNLIDECLNKL
jgi:hypothetical protein